MDTARELSLTRLIQVPRHSLYRCWTEPALLKQWFAPAPLTTPHAELDVRVGGASLVVMQMSDGTQMPNHGTYLDVIPDRHLVFTDAYTGDWVPKPDGKPFMTVILTFEDEAGATRYTAKVRHWTEADREIHENMGFHQGWGQCADQLAALAATL